MGKIGLWGKFNPLAWVLLVQGVLVFIAFYSFWVDPIHFMLPDGADVAKNMFTFQAYLQQATPISEFRLMQYVYPYGDSIFYADITPIIAIPLKLFCLYVYDVSSYGIIILNFAAFFLQFIVVVPIYNILDRFLKTPWLIAFLSINLAWIHPQLFECLDKGWMNLSTPLFFLWAINLLIHLYDNYTRTEKVGKRWLANLFVLLFLAAFTHLYYLPMLGVIIGGFVAFWVGLRIHNKEGCLKDNLRLIFYVSIVELGALVLIMIIIQKMDVYYHLRDVGNNAYNWRLLALNFSEILSARDINTIQSPIQYNKDLANNMYLGSFFIYGILGLLIIKFFCKKYFKSILNKKSENGRLLNLLLFASVISFFISIGEYYPILNGDYIFKNYFNPFFYLHKITLLVEQFRCTSRFFWVTFWIWNLGLGSLVDKILQKRGFPFIKAGVLIISVLGVIDVMDSVKYFNQRNTSNIFEEKNVKKKYPELSNIPFDEYQAILPIPYFCVGCESHGFYLTAGQETYNSLLSIVLTYDIPMMAAISSRLPIKNIKGLFSIFLDKEPNIELLEKLSDKPILLLYYKLATKEHPANEYEPAKTIALKGAEIIKKYDMELLANGESFMVYKWDISSIRERVVDEL